MKKFLFAVAVVALYAATVEAQPATPVTPVVPSTPYVTAGAPVVQYGSTTTTRRGLFSRLRNRNTNSMNMVYPSAPVMSAPVLGPTTPTPPLAPAPMPMPGTRTGGMVVPANMVVSSGGLPPGIYTATDGTVIQIGGTTPMTNGTVVPASGYTPMSMQTQTQTSRRGLLGRLRNR